MSAQAWFLAALVAASAAALLMLAQWGWSSWSTRRWLAERTSGRLQPSQETTVLGGARVDLGPLETFLLRANITWSRRRLTILALLIVGTLVLVGISRGPVVLLVTLFFVVTAVAIAWRVRFQKQRQIIHEELAGIIDGVLRNIEAGRSLEHSLITAFDEASPVFRPLVFRLRNGVESGREYTGLFEDFSRLYRVPALIMVAIALRTSSRFGSSIRPVLQQVASSLRSQQELRQEFLAATAETRFTAATFALLPPGLAAYMVLMNDDYADLLLNTSTGHNLLIAAGVLQVLGMVVIWRMIQGVGRG
ncbi:MAG: type II secretion system F family protein [Marinobacter sp.]|uniref:type II secretion system F family protein n=2 Tax=Marinobacter sp. TaxID=50741 RepID=UPI00299E6764|nr:type II secretion system F family protein [Marinobacter sp.]MDX1635435.1 type II secretion system F family protein [Marinobacter sp.]